MTIRFIHNRRVRRVGHGPREKRIFLHRETSVTPAGQPAVECRNFICTCVTE